MVTSAPQPDRPRRRFGLRGPHLGLRARITLAFTLSAMLLSVLLAGTTWALTRRNLIDQRIAAATRQAYLNARIMQPQLRGSQSDPDAILTSLSSLDTQSGSRSVLRIGTRNPRWIAQLPTFGKDALPPALRALVDKGTPARMTIDVGGEPQMAVGIPLPRVDAAYYEFGSLVETNRTLESLSASLFGAAVVTTLAGTALGWWTSRRTLRPLAEVSVAAEAIAGGRLDTRLGAVDDPDLGVLVSSFNHMAQALETRVDRDGRFASDVSHELRSPLMTLSASIEVLASRRDDMPDASAQAAVDLMVADVGRFKQLVEDLLEISRFDAGAARLDLSEVRLGELVTQAVSWSADRDVPVQLDSELAGIVIRADKRRIVRVIANLIDNAEKYGGGATAVQLRKVAGGVHIAVEDNGPGVPADERDIVFDRFARGVGANRRSGTEGVGLGLSLVAEHVGLHKGRVWVEDRPDGEPGARFVVELPVAWS
ncbi:MAG: putative two-component histidine kinase [Acidimicrobiales bacterium]|nr:putative two-component histidine kinase [Acidimicrobiales bacterium]